MNTINQQIQEIIHQQKSLQSVLDRCVKELSEKESSVSETKRQDLSKVISQAELNGLAINDHYMATFDNDLKDQYACLLITLLKEISVVLSEEQYVLLRLLLRSIKLSNEVSHYFEGNTVIDDQFLLDFKAKIEGKKEAAQALMADVMMIARINSTFIQQALQTLSELMSFFEIKESQVKEIDNWSAYILGISDYIILDQYAVEANLESKGKKIQSAFDFASEYNPYMLVSNIHDGKVFYDMPILTIKHYEYQLSKKSVWVTRLDSSNTELSMIYEEYIRATRAGFFVATIQSDDHLNDGYIILGQIIVIPEYLSFWYSFIDLEKVIKENK